MSRYDFNQVIKGPTRITRSTQSQIDLMFTNRTEHVIKTFNLITGLSNHNMILAASKLTKKHFVNYRLGLPNVDKLIIPKQDLPILERKLSEVTWNDVLQSTDPNTCCIELMNAINKIISKFLKTAKKSKRKNSLPWVNSSIRQLMKQRDLALKAYLKNRTNTAQAIYKGLRNRVTKEPRAAKATYYVTLLTEAKGNSSFIWKQIKSLIKPQRVQSIVQELKIGDQTLTDSGTIAQTLKDYFVGSVEDTARTFKTSVWSGPTIAEKKGQMLELKQISKNQVAEIIKKIKTNHSKDLFNLDIAFVKTHANALAEPLTHLISQSASCQPYLRF